jgi:hypothetical protein
MGRPHRPRRPHTDDLDAPSRRRHPGRRSRPGVPDPGTGGRSCEASSST